MRNFDTNGYLNISGIAEDAGTSPFIIIIGARGTGKTYGLLEYLIQTGHVFLLLRRTDETVKFLSTYKTSPIYPINQEIRPFRQNKITEFSPFEVNDKGKMKKTGEPVGFMAAASRISGMRGFSGETIEDIVYDEFIPERGDFTRKGEFERLLNTYETINRNRELQGRPAVRMWLLSNANEFENFFFTGLGITDFVRRNRHKDKIEFSQAGLVIYNIHNSPISQQKADTALYRLTKNVSGRKEFNDMALDNRFYFNDANIKRQPLKDYRQIAVVEESFSVYRHKSLARLYFTEFKISDKKAIQLKSPEQYRQVVGFNPMVDIFFDSYRTRQKVQKFLA